MNDPVVLRWKFNLRQMMVAIAVVGGLLGCLAWGARHGFFWWASQAVELSLYVFPNFAWVAGATAIFALGAAVVDRRVWHFRSLWLLLPFALPVAILAFGMAFRHYPGDNVPASTIDQRQWIVAQSHWLLVPVGIVLLGCFRSTSKWLIIGCVSTTALWLTFGAQFMSLMAVTNIWL